MSCLYEQYENNFNLSILYFCHLKVFRFALSLPFDALGVIFKLALQRIKMKVRKNNILEWYQVREGEGYVPALRKFFKRIWEYKMRLNHRNAGMTSRYLGLWLVTRGIEVDPAKIKTISLIS